ncbi:hypothetical protein [Trujillonella endophytica]|uniref:Predicted metalloprotease n=1 Tax=Trujillonella endophytica TaxID=673521 RepID=A0A1H8TKA3_9ACTN|nr:hypothetical protein [Trujillella endophytica]SEO90918.1 Predicted metalloprotease [Trujillella endophytica]
MRQVSRRALVAAAVGSTLLTGCTTSVAGSANPPATDVSAEEFPIVGAADNDVDRLARNAFADLNTFWAEAFPEYYGEDFLPLQGPTSSVDVDDIDYSLYPSDTGLGCDEYPIDPAEVEMNAFYHRGCDIVAYDRAFILTQMEQFGAYINPAIMAHEFGHLVQGPIDEPAGRAGFSDVTIYNETQADCFAGAFTRWVADGNAEHTTVRVADLDPVLTGFIELRDPVGLTDVNVQGAHGSGFDRASAFYEGYDAGIAACRDNYAEGARVFTVDEFGSDEQGQIDEENEGNAPIEDVPAIIDGTLPVYFDSWVDGFEAPTLSFDGSTPDCGVMGEEERALGWCEDDNTIYVAEDLLEGAYNEIGDFAVATAYALPFAQAVRAHLGRSADDTTATVCLAGAYTASFFNGDFEESENGATLSPGDVDEAITFLLTYGQTESVLPNVSATGFELVGAFRAGFLQGPGADVCDVQA